jgi:LPXTG-site transpeptidase (sortase) family protein
VFAHAFGNVLLGMAIGLVSYYYLTGLLTQVEQRSLAAELPAHVTSAMPPPSEEPTEPFDWAGWQAEDVAYWRSLDPGEPLGRLTSEAMDLDAVVVKGTSRSDLMKGPGWITYTDLPGPTGNFGVAGHRTTYGAPFRHIDALEKGDVITFTSPFRIYEYRVRRIFSVTPDRVDVMNTSDDESLLTMSACHPPYSARLRLIAQSELVSVRKLEQ